MTQADDSPGRVEPKHDYRSLPPGVPLEQTIESVEADPAPDPEAGRNADRHRALRDD